MSKKDTTINNLTLNHPIILVTRLTEYVLQIFIDETATARITYEETNLRMKLKENFFFLTFGESRRSQVADLADKT